ncbi:hypothetical protein Pst134EA_019398 [Puccinia striiformis f. sp. tritici]|uniref:hypothetical protein n=1 Tax=Puccinia striiformis f. sp. tritici TaxID=168172 RepID=UPI0020089954|nr:hypothetical protein Pst134EA_019398 [Puccinia striiformis f. sp. tritici]KAH9459246.1 hypothetical protein Pst134EA_019398 [Puccinia striiformis f. sp. tritici]
MENDPHQDTENEEHPLKQPGRLETTIPTDPKELTEAIVAIKNINPIFSTTLVECLKRIQSASNTRLIIEERSKLAYKTELHRDKFKELLAAQTRSGLRNSTPQRMARSVFKLLSFSDLRFTKPNNPNPVLLGHHEKIGFQGTDPSTDLRGAGLLGLDALIMFGRYFGSIGQEIVTEAIEGGSSWYPWALASINITWWCVRLSKDRQLDYFLLIQSSCKSDDRQESLTKDIPIELYEFLILQSRLTLLFIGFGWIEAQTFRYGLPKLNSKFSRNAFN